MVTPAVCNHQGFSLVAINQNFIQFLRFNGLLQIVYGVQSVRLQQGF